MFLQMEKLGMEIILVWNERLRCKDLKILEEKTNTWEDCSGEWRLYLPDLYLAKDLGLTSLEIFQCH
ncbi:hypothetical protein C5167_044012 [Papaver somniferum]|uniref:Uncharacterized protein n=1 Tax=Papaver somniferum TaxID=3469 RepID=A0A4Y7LB56_PAPSO|nr:hypothetical protein C5167_044012 [Papaver somniferum]